ncbi:MAG TPA: ribosomal protein S18-alanine N-acetyltransferase [Gammaproteobacteria bacterium]|jgi:ribosomal-protein-alanine N-acetyltransferase|nr:ribosomal protein S18-alanine N-acetyltransferase [Gammaproteobacteria bacterium]
MLRPLQKSDIPAVFAIESSVQISPWVIETFHACFRAGYVGWVLEKEGSVIGFVIISVALDECHILNLCVAHAHQRCGLGKQLLQHVLDYASSQGAKMVYLEVRRSNTRAIALYRDAGFQLIGERKGYYPTTAGMEDALVLAYQNEKCEI